MGVDRPMQRQRVVAPRVRSQQAADRLVRQMRSVGSDRVLPKTVWLMATELPRVIAIENGAG